MNIKEQLLALAYEQEDRVFGSSERDEFDCLIALIEDGTIDTFEELARYGVKQDITTHEIKLTTDPERIRQANYLLNGGR